MNDDSVKIFRWDFFNSTSVPSLTMVMINGPRGNTNGPMDPKCIQKSRLMCSEVRKNSFMYICGKQRSHVIRTDYFLTVRWLFFFNMKKRKCSSLKEL